MVRRLGGRAASAGLASLRLASGVYWNASKSLGKLELARSVLRKPAEELAEHALCVLVPLTANAVGFHQGLKPFVLHTAELLLGRAKGKGFQRCKDVFRELEAVWI